ncbi:MAG: type II toxin-antitoxin system RelE/ParE family toxin [Phycisphaerales bacterium]|nr:type II toxin-antitoxin system RelE/ParE family toxin [Phycisphaerales bacterium]
MRYTVVFHSEARDEALDAAEYIAANGSDEAALRWYEGLEAAIGSLETMPARCGYAREHGSFPGVELRQLVYKSHRLIFTIRQAEVHVLHLRHVARADIDSTPDNR